MILAKSSTSIAASSGATPAATSRSRATERAWRKITLRPGWPASTLPRCRTTPPVRAERVDAQVFVVDLNIHILGFGQHRDGGRRRMDAAAGLGGRHALHAVHAALVLQPAVHALAFDRRDDFLDAAPRALARGQYVD